ncbi:MAG: phage major capsid protein [Christensenellales bacterium]|jgi:HK97 family phage major capsid protein
MAKIFEMKQNRAKINADIRAHMDKFDSAEMSAEDKNVLAQLEREFDDLTETINREERQLERDRLAGEAPAKEGEKPRDKAHEIFARALGGSSEAIREYRNASSTLADDAQAGYLTAPVQFVERLIKGLDDEVFIRRLSTVVGPIGAAQSLGFPALTTDASDAEWTTEVAQAGEETTIAFGRREFKPNRLAKRIKISDTLMRHAPMAEETILSRLRYKIGVAQEQAYMTGDGSSKPLGVFVAHDDGIPTARDVSTGNTATAVTFDGLMNAKYSLKGGYHRSAQWIMHRDLVKAIAKIKDGEGQYVWQPSVQLGQPDFLLGSPVNMSEFAPNTYTTGKYAAIYGDFKAGYWVCDADQVYLKVLNELYAEYNQIGYVIHYFGDGAPVLSEAFARVKLG